MYVPVSTPTFDEAYKKLIKGNLEKEKRMNKTVDLHYPTWSYFRVLQITLSLSILGLILKRFMK